MSSKAKRVLPTRPEPPSVEQVLADVRSSHPGDPVFVLPVEPPCDQAAPSGPAEESEQLFQQSRTYVEMTQRLQEAQEQLRLRRQKLQQAGETLDRSIADMRQKA
ncbi:CS025 protein, partial [Rhinopomastus cyanomelas]|nr:CS025 protein [Rhinopomastus cyanomelas]